ncbi:ubiquitin-conjugating enzyme E2 T-like [Thrips palmi]|uniref:Ubiquitin-conjugating enzyme E2 T-like n=1 Tax=Thrips palmi TaxID=161013 RepID=A0A6P8YNX7_THRPL|nr:ubiquitin-conjugating enzyme E2 T-like [Thrips palmi]
MAKKDVRVKRELERIAKQPPAGISLCPISEDNVLELRATIIGLAGTPYESGVFKLDVSITDRYPYEPPMVRFKTPVYHPNIDTSGRICLELLKLPPTGCWRPVVTIEGVLLAIQSLMATPNPDDPLMDGIARQYVTDKKEFERSAKEHTLLHACQTQPNSANGSNSATGANNENSKGSEDLSSQTPPSSSGHKQKME